MAQAPNRTQYASQAVAAADFFAAKFRDKRYGPARRALRLGEPDGPSTDGGRKARQPVILQTTPDDGLTVVVGFIDVAKKAAELRTHAAIAEHFRVRFERPFDVPERDYEAMVTEAGAFLRELG